jgi:hypothetical protein
MTVLLREDAADFLVKSRRKNLSLPAGAAIGAMGKVLEGRGDEPMEKADALSPDEPIPAREPACSVCGRIFANPGAYARHRIATGHGPQRERTPNENVVTNPDGEYEEELEKAIGDPHASKIEKFEAVFLLAKAQSGRRVKGKRQCTICGAVVDDTRAGLHKHSRATNHGSFAPYFK